MTKVRRLIGAALAVALGAWAGVVVAGRRDASQIRHELRDVKPADVGEAVTHTAVPESPAVDVPSLAKLGVRLLSDIDDQPVAMTVRLWRLDLPEDDAWTAGDELSRGFDVDAEGFTVDGLPLGRYRIHCLDARANADDPPEFSLTAGVNERVLVVAPRRWFRLRLRLVDESGRAIRGGVRRRDGFRSTSSSGDDDSPPNWAHPRRMKPDFPERVHFGTGSAIGCGFGGKIAAVDSDDDGFFDVGRRRERGRRGYEMWNDEYLPVARTSVDVHADDEAGVDATFVGVATTPDVLVARVTCPDGSRLDPSSATITTKCRAVRFPWTPPADAWRTVPVHVKIVKQGCEPLEFDWTAATADAPHALVASRPKSSK